MLRFDRREAAVLYVLELTTASSRPTELRCPPASSPPKRRLRQILPLRSSGMAHSMPLLGRGYWERTAVFCEFSLPYIFRTKF